MVFKQATLSEDFKKNCSYLIDLSEPRADNSIEFKKDWKFTWFLKFDSASDTYDFELNWLFIKNQLIDEKKAFSISLPKQIGLDLGNKQQDELDFHFLTSNNNRKYWLYFDIDNKFTNEDSSNYIKIRVKNTKQIDNFISVDHLNNKLNGYLLGSSDSLLKIKRNEKFSIEILCKMDSQMGDCSFDSGFCDYTTNPFVNSTLFPSLISSSEMDGFFLKHLPKFDTLNTNDFDVLDKAKDFYLSIEKSLVESTDSIYSPLIQVQEIEDRVLFNRKAYSISFSYLMSNRSSSELQLFLVQNRSDVKANLKVDFYQDVIGQYSSVSHLVDAKVSLSPILNECPMPLFSSKGKRMQTSARIGGQNWYHVKQAKFFSCFDFRFGFTLAMSKGEDEEKEAVMDKQRNFVGLDDVEINEEGELNFCAENICGKNGKCFDFSGHSVCCCNPGYEV